jgi:hypothetical protein
MAPEETWVRWASNGTPAVGEGAGWGEQWRRGWQKFLTALMRAMSGWAV